MATRLHYFWNVPHIGSYHIHFNYGAWLNILYLCDFGFPLKLLLLGVLTLLQMWGLAIIHYSNCVCGVGGGRESC